MSYVPTLGIPELAGVATYAAAARIGVSVEENVQRLLRMHWTERWLMDVLVAHLPATPEWEIKCAFALHQWLSSERADALRRRISEMRHPEPSYGSLPDSALGAFLEELLRADGSIELVAGVYGVALPALGAAYRHHVATTNPLIDHPTMRIVRSALSDVDDAVAWGTVTLDALTSTEADRDRSRNWISHLSAYLDAAGGIAGERQPPAGERPRPRATRPFVADLRPRRDARFSGTHEFEFPPHVVYNAPDVPADERNLALLCKRTLEMDVPELIASILWERRDQPWEFIRDYSRQLWDEARHAMMGTVAFEARGVDWSTIPLNVGFSLRLNAHATPLERQILLFAIEQSLMPGDTGKRFEYETAREAGDALSAHFHDYDWADEVLHAQIGRRLLKREGISVDEARERGRDVHERTWRALEAYRREGPPLDWWDSFVRRHCGHASAAVVAPDSVPDIVAK
jgi:hypothetical protein